jgi:hypothetical protein
MDYDENLEDALEDGCEEEEEEEEEGEEDGEDEREESGDAEADNGPDIDTLNAKIAALISESVAKDAVIADLTNQVTVAKAANYDLLVSNGSAPAETTTVTDDGDAPDIADFFGE